LRKAYFQKPYDVVPYTQSFDEYIDYDKNGNIDRLHRFADQNEYGNVIEIDALGYHYEQHSNKLMKVTDATNFSAGFSDDGEDGDDSPDENDDYAYDDNGNMISDENKGITSIKYNHLNLPTSINFENGNKIHYLYTAAGVKVGKTVIKGGQDPVVTDYLGGFQYLNGNLQFFPQPEGYVSVVKFGPATLVINYAYQYKDHLGNIRLNFGKDPETNVLRVLEENHYYPFGLKHQNYNTGRRQLGKKEEILAGNLTLMPAFVLPTEDKPMAYKYKYNGKEWQDELGQNVYAYGWRDYDPAIGRFQRLDRFSEKYFELTPYGYAGNNPILFNDIQGDSIGVGKDLFNKFRDNVNDRKNKILNNRQSRIDKALSKGKTDKANNLQAKFARRDEKEGSEMSVLNSTLSELNQLESSSQVYNLYENSSNVGADADGNVTYNTSSHEVNINSKGAFSMGVFAHELKHAFQFETGYLSFGANGINGGALYDLTDEFEAFDRGAFFGGRNLSRSEISSIYGARGVPAGPLSMNTPTGAGVSTLGTQLRTGTTVNAIRGSAQTNFYIGSNNIVRVIQAIQNFRIR
jgi:RHS repeat-associated protein